ncbi:MAG TPA: AI-2E family transporter [Aquabacterium sp.]|uniref:AI-2E family transporter n=1 Tax=Aquabacterium sp. TaxID=1872578 RepID=UPI002E320DE0|nr:AI-2E family transporter [Aquabacterium sp.]HEX5371557.1 AI-2E family transporter [Aquabacterium sp.]
MSDALNAPRAPSGPNWSSLIATSLSLGVVGVLVWLNALILAPFVLSLALAYVLEPIVARLVGWRVPRLLAVVLSVLGAVLLALLLLLLLVPIALELAPMLRQQLPELAGRGWHVLVPWLTQVGVKVPHDLGDLRPILVNLMNSHGEQWARAALSSLMVGGSAMLTLAGLAVLVPMLAFYWLLDWTRLMGLARDLVPLPWRAGMDGFLAEADEMLGHYLRGQILVMLILAAYYSVALMLFGFDLALPIGVFTGLAVFIPYLGFGLGLVLALLAGVLQFSADPSGGLWWPVMAVAVVYGLGQLIESMLLTPRLVGERIGLHPAGVIFVLMLFGQWLGFVGVLMALPVSALLMVVLRRGVQRYRRSRLYLGSA